MHDHERPIGDCTMSEVARELIMRLLRAGNLSNAALIFKETKFLFDNEGVEELRVLLSPATKESVCSDCGVGVACVRSYMIGGEFIILCEECDSRFREALDETFRGV